MNNQKKTKEQLIQKLDELQEKSARQADRQRKAIATLRKKEQRYHRLIDSANDAMITMNSRGKVILWNKAAENMFGYTIDEVKDAFFDLITVAPQKHKNRFKAVIAEEEDVIGPNEAYARNSKGQKFPVEVTTSTCRADRERFVTIVVRDITARKKTEADRENLIYELQLALEKVKTLSGLLPICASCKKVRNDSGYWQQIESYVSEHSDADFSHCICPECREKLYPGIKRK